jgi:hypothetical protein
MPTRRNTLVDVICDYLHQTDLAVLIRSDSGDEVWLPKSRCETDPEDLSSTSRGMAITVTCERSLAEEKGLV